MTSPDDRPDTPGGQPPEPVKHRPNVGTVKPGDYPDEKRSGQAGLDEEKEHERLNPGDADATPRSPGQKRDLA